MRFHRFHSRFLIAVTLLGTSGVTWAQGDEAEGEPAEQETDPPPSPPERIGVRDVAGSYRAARFEDCVVGARRLLDPKDPSHATEPGEVDAATTYLGTCLVRTGRTTQAEELFEQWIYDGAKRNAVPSKPNVALYGAAAAEAYEVAYRRVSARLEIERERALEASKQEKKDADERARAEAERQQVLLELASKETVVTQNRRWLASVPLGVGQFQNGKPGLGWLFLTTEALALGVTLGGMAAEIEFASHAPNQADNGREADSALDLSTSEDRARVTWVTGLYLFTALAAGGIVEAHLNFVPQFEEQRKRQVPKELREPIQPQTGVRLAPFTVPGGSGVGITGHF